MLLSNASVYLDVSMYDSDLPGLAVLGWAFAVVAGGEVVGIARGVRLRT